MGTWDGLGTESGWNCRIEMFWNYVPDKNKEQNFSLWLHDNTNDGLGINLDVLFANTNSSIWKIWIDEALFVSAGSIVAAFLDWALRH